ncbi:hypothetical protein LC971_13435, partial [Enterococcus faecium]|nr:hypothetical protein [Enterococcus faecium]MCH3333520.1 hypothetical protein [Enterococcus faecium]MCH3457968.1 hypothetical protein [Enterococcus faecium]MCH3460574.1 hypothetical protein [Enterococcus faecium]MCH3583481.1 hypothetical protein [Enterococcus faecium]
LSQNEVHSDPDLILYNPSVLIDKEPKKGVDFSTPKKSNFWGSLQVDNSFLFTNQLDIYKLYFLTNFIDIKKLI